MKVLIIEDDNIFGEMVSLYLAEEDFDVRRAATGREGLETFLEFEPDAVLLDLDLPDMNGLQVCADIRLTSHAPIIIVSMTSKVSEKVRALSAGADDFVSKPFSMQELKARILSVVRKTRLLESMQTARVSPETNAASPIRVDPDSRTLYVNDEPRKTTYSEFEIIRLLAAYPGKVFARDDLINATRGIDGIVNERSIDVHITNLRKKIEPDPKKPVYIQTVWGIGYRYVPPAG